MESMGSVSIETILPRSSWLHSCLFVSIRGLNKNRKNITTEATEKHRAFRAGRDFLCESLCPLW